MSDIFLLFGCPSILQSDCGGEFLNAVLHRLTAFLSINHVFASGNRPRLNGATERLHCFLSSAIGIYCEHYQHRWEDFLQSAIYAHNTSPISGKSDITPCFLVIGHDAPSPETLFLQLPPDTLRADHYAQQLITRIKDVQDNFSNFKSELHHSQHEIYDTASQDLHTPDGTLVYVCKDCLPSGPNTVSCFIRTYDSSYLVIGHHTHALISCIYAKLIPVTICQALST